MTDEEILDCIPELDDDCVVPTVSPKPYIAAHFMLWFLTWINAAGPITFWYAWMKP